MLTDSKLRKMAAEAIENKLGFKVSRNDIVLLEATGDGTYIRFHRYGFDRIVYTTRKKAYSFNIWEWELCIYNEYPDGKSIGAGDELYI